jgi:hypothetical protein
MDCLVNSLASCPTDPLPVLCDQLIADCLGSASGTDDVCLLVARRTPDAGRRTS